MALFIPLDPEFVQGLGYRFQRVKRDDENIEDVYDGAIYQSKCGPGGFLSEPYNLSVKLNTDGVAIFHSSQFGVWPLFLLVNELPPSLRYVNKSECLYDDNDVYMMIILHQIGEKELVHALSETYLYSAVL